MHYTLLDKYIEKKLRMVFNKANVPFMRVNASDSRMADVTSFVGSTRDSLKQGSTMAMIFPNKGCSDEK
jgi:hypothetical protein